MLQQRRDESCITCGSRVHQQTSVWDRRRIRRTLWSALYESDPEQHRLAVDIAAAHPWGYQNLAALPCKFWQQHGLNSSAARVVTSALWWGHIHYQSFRWLCCLFGS